MFILCPVGPSGLEQSASAQAVALGSSGFLVCPPMFWPAQQSSASWAPIYRLAYEQLVIAFGPSRFQRAIEPSLN
jgi:hypothetical protein